ncbi:dihydropteroate synthase [Gammaproteobacteria bacterium 42_54_T18]|nr:dihydropteroate synthase [Gammaproteobacteria bacterium 42_54_T18]
MSKSTAPGLRCGAKLLDLSSPVVMGVLNVTPDSFSDGGSFVGRDKAVARAGDMLESGAAIIDVGGESTRPGAAPVSVQEELDRVMPVVEALIREFQCIVSVDTSTPEVMLAAANAGAGLINDVRALQRPGALDVVASLGLPVCLMHMQGQPGTMQQNPNYKSIEREVMGFFVQRIDACVSAGVSKERLLLDPGFGFGKTLEHNMSLLSGLAGFSLLGLPLLVGVSRKTMIGEIVNKPVDQRLCGSVAAAVLAVERGANIVRVHDVPETVDALKVVAAMRGNDLVI